MEQIILDDMKIVNQNSDARLLDLGDGIACLQFLSKGNSITPAIKAFIVQGLDKLKSDFDGLVIGNQCKNFSVGANLHTIKQNIDRGDFAEYDKSISLFQQLNRQIKLSEKPIVAAPYGYALGGGLEIVLHCSSRVAAEDSRMGLVEVGVGLLPGAGGTKECALQIACTTPSLQHQVIQTIFDKLLLRKISRDAQDARALLYLQPDDRVVVKRDELLGEAKKRCLELIGQMPSAKEEVQITLPGRTARKQMTARAEELFSQGEISSHELEIGKHIAVVLSGDSDRPVVLNENQLLDIERRAFLSLAQTKGTYERICYFLDTGKLLRN